MADTSETPVHRKKTPKLCVEGEAPRLRENRVKSIKPPATSKKGKIWKCKFTNPQVLSDLQSWLMGMFLAVWLSGAVLMLHVFLTKSAGLTRTLHVVRNASVFKHQSLSSLFKCCWFPHGSNYSFSALWMQKKLNQGDGMERNPHQLQ